MLFSKKDSKQKTFTNFLQNLLFIYLFIYLFALTFQNYLIAYKHFQLIKKQKREKHLTFVIIYDFEQKG